MTAYPNSQKARVAVQGEVPSDVAPQAIDYFAASAADARQEHRRRSAGAERRHRLESDFVGSASAPGQARRGHGIREGTCLIT